MVSQTHSGAAGSCVDVIDEAGVGAIGFDAAFIGADKFELIVVALQSGNLAHHSGAQAAALKTSFVKTSILQDVIGCQHGVTCVPVQESWGDQGLPTFAPGHKDLQLVNGTSRIGRDGHVNGSQLDSFHILFIFNVCICRCRNSDFSSMPTHVDLGRAVSWLT
ncbi:uncharacterized protein MONBRDRAFT_6882 [Monosiga brevicollis MX1]|uniref:Uncharacterized protein n=1 Tax=Monosiga brevicollis TaxID=81824 RepID=A9UUI8_MONBE|nr:uncharacterized protein MONBRDRAFT_6882 [Monosiga brevicollis MX1]EDQ91105.1 predicted protein [Monosiga brevicollis MX1]|eukprot:XP_001744402.1 hypothetical protein [Monosiga brevicollis MX1]